MAMEINRSGVSRTTVRKVFGGGGLPPYEPTMAVVDYMLREVRRETGSDLDEILDDESRRFEELWQAARVAQKSLKQTDDFDVDPIEALVVKEYQRLDDVTLRMRDAHVYRVLTSELGSRYGIQIDAVKLIGYLIRIRRPSTAAVNGQVDTD
ncbi:hypothetical protein [Streptomyces sp. NPDC024089]|uniref:hypothetical protein n=1 Tax=Streptomyces sp. NPDC024089 TaxID=3154328 RepID=UPI0033D0BEE7